MFITVYKMQYKLHNMDATTVKTTYQYIALEHVSTVVYQS